MRERVSREADHREAGCLAIEVAKLLVKLYQTGTQVIGQLSEAMENGRSCAGFY
jgi:hypothetical protein